MNKMNSFFIDQKELVEQLISSNRKKLEDHKKLGEKSPYSIFEIARLMDELCHFSKKTKQEVWHPVLISKN